MRQTLKMEAVYACAPEQIWQALTDRRALATWLMENDFEPQLGHRFQFQQRSLPGLEIVIHCQVITLDSPRCLAYTWQEQWMEQPSIVTWTLKATESGTRLHLDHSGLGTTSSKELVSPAHLWQRELQSQPRTMVMDYPATLSLQPNSPSVKTTAEVYPFDFEQEWHYRLKQKLAKFLTQAADQ